MALADDRVFFRYAVSLQNDLEETDYPRLERQWCFDALLRLRRERETMQILDTWSLADDRHVKSSLHDCWDHELYWIGLNLARRSKLPMSVKLASLAGCSRVPPESVIAEMLNGEVEALTPADKDMAAVPPI